MRVGVAVLACALLAVMPVSADDERQRQTLIGLRGVSVVVEDLNPDTERDGLSGSTLQADVEQRLRQAGISVMTEAQAGRSPGAPHLYLKLDALKHTAGFYAYHLQLGLRQRVTLDRSPRVTRFAMTWSAPDLLGTVAWANLPSIRADVKERVDQFIKAYFAANPKK